MKDIIIKRAITELQKEGLRFSIDEVAKSLKISKKTIYKYFPTKEDLAVAIYKSFYENAISQIGLTETVHLDENVAKQMLTVYFQSHCMVRNEIFNKYSLNESIRLLAQSNHKKIKFSIEKKLPQSDKDALMIIIDGSLQKLCESEGSGEEVLNRLVTLLC